ncbi:uncharacterized protein C8Q71DRAFT_737687 [Rhodofomes roseus]|uniref:SP-RING-type domain-containing protein n=1 Tax=Rhodofomes roseus TaxID=34475 RepID=A0ABQ8KTG2_9APHY|nr:uncharacterized protein C8Q71DRAFT_737687 [Rhodofomes roseus]KAH9841572.1 hypothetical protein C8Q71DRAFT_737687 [Rhodofomes roseus]
MPVAGPSRRNRRDASEDGIEEAMPTQGTDDVVNDDEEEQSRRGAKVKKEKSKGSRKTAQAVEAEDNDDDDADADPLADFGDQPIDRAQAQKIHGFSQDWDMMRKTKHVQMYGLVKDAATAFAEFAEPDPASKLLIEMDTLMRDLMDTETEMLYHNKILHDLHQQIVRGEEISNIADRYDDEIRTKVAEYKKGTSRQKYGKSDQYASYKQAVFEVENPGVGMPPMADLIPREDGDESDDDDDDVQVGGVTQDYKCPLTLTILVEPLTSKTCGHSYSAASIREYIGVRGGRQQCPAAGCHKSISLGDLEPNKELAKKAKDAARRERMREEDSDEGEVIE